MAINKLASAYVTTRDRGFGVMAKATVRLCLKTFQQKVLQKRFLQRRIHSFDMLLDVTDNGLSRSLILFRTREVDHKVMLERIVNDGMTIFDIGGNIGYYPLMELGLLGGSGKMVIVEPSPNNVKLLSRNLELNGYRDVPIVPAAVSDEMGEKTFYISSKSNLGTFHPVGSGSETLTGETLDVKTVTVSSLAQKYGAPNLIRMDVEGHEVDVLNGMHADIKDGTYAPQIIFETHLSRYGKDNDMGAALQGLFDLGYQVTLASSSSDVSAKRLVAMGYAPGQRIATDGIHRTLFSDISHEDTITIITKTGGFRTVLLAKAIS